LLHYLEQLAPLDGVSTALYLAQEVLADPDRSSCIILSQSK